MATVEVIMPQMGESIAEGTIIKWHKRVGDPVKKDETLLEISTDKVDSEIPSSVNGVLSKILVSENETVPVQTVIALIDTDGEGTSVPSAEPHRREEPVEKVTEVEEPATVQAEDRIASSKSSGEKPRDRFYSPLVLNIARQENISMSELESVAGTGSGGRVSKKDILAYIEAKKAGKVAAPQTAGPAQRYEIIESRDGVDIIKMDTMRKAIAEHMVRSVQTSPHVSSVTEADMSRIAAYRDKQKAGFERREGFKLTYTPFMVDAVIKALKQYPLINASIDGDKILVKRYINIGVAVALENGLIVPVIKNADEKNLTGIARAVNDLAVRARSKKLTPDEVRGGTFTITNPGIFGNLWGTPIINQPQLAIMGVGAIKKRPVVIDDMIAIRSMVYISMSYDHRLIDGAMGGMFLQAVVKNLENFDITQSI
jgi:2-oxoglutarate dehydrogenase E2 component (dihydrolipoamide succinyltransferase)